MTRDPRAKELLRELVASAERLDAVVWAAYEGNDKCRKCVEQGYCQSYRDVNPPDGTIEPRRCTGGGVIVAIDALDNDDYPGETDGEGRSALQRARAYLDEPQPEPEYRYRVAWMSSQAGPQALEIYEADARGWAQDQRDIGMTNVRVERAQIGPWTPVE